LAGNLVQYLLQGFAIGSGEQFVEQLAALGFQAAAEVLRVNQAVEALACSIGGGFFFSCFLEISYQLYFVDYYYSLFISFLAFN